MARIDPFKHHMRSWLSIFGATFLVIVIAAIIIPQIMSMTWKNAVYPKTMIGNLDLGGKTYAEALKSIQAEWNTISANGVEFLLNNERVVINTIVISPSDPDFTYELIHFDSDETLKRLIMAGRDGTLMEKIIQPYRNLLTTTHINADIDINALQLEKALRDNFSVYEQPARDAQFLLVDDSIGIAHEQTGSIIDIDHAFLQLEYQLSQFNNKPIVLTTKKDIPKVTAKDIRPLIPNARALFSRTPFTLSVNLKEDSGRTYKWSSQATSTMVEQWLGITKTNGKSTLTFNEHLHDYLVSVSLDINREPQDAKFDITKNGRITQFQSSSNGLALNFEKSYKQIIRDIIHNKQQTSELVVDIVPPTITTEAANSLGIKEIIGVGQSDFSGSPVNRRKNIQVSSEKLNGLLILPDEEFSLVAALKPFTEKAGYVPELVIKGSRLIPEIGGGACQIGTTTFRAALNAGLEITQRRNHSFAVRYYNDENGLPGTDATIYDPAPDLRFRNNTGNHILLQTHIGDDDILTYEFWGTNDGRTASSSKPEILASFPAPETKYIETKDLPPGETNCSGSNVPGYNTTFTYHVEYADGARHEENFDSYYRPFQKVCLIGVEQEEEEGELVN